jgi:hypothetical protein
MMVRLNFLSWQQNRRRAPGNLKTLDWRWQQTNAVFPWRGDTCADDYLKGLA